MYMYMIIASCVPGRIESRGKDCRRKREGGKDRRKVSAYKEKTGTDS